MFEIFELGDKCRWHISPAYYEARRYFRLKYITGSTENQSKSFTSMKV